MTLNDLLNFGWTVQLTCKDGIYLANGIKDRTTVFGPEALSIDEAVTDLATYINMARAWQPREWFTLGADTSAPVSHRSPPRASSRPQRSLHNDHPI